MGILVLTGITLLVIDCGAGADDRHSLERDREKQAEIARLRTISEAFRLITVELTEIGKGQGIEGAESSARTLQYSVTLNNPTAYEHFVIYSVYWTARSFIPRADVCSLRADGLFPRENWPGHLTGSAVLQPFESVTRPNEFSPFSDCFDFDLSSAGADIVEIDEFASYLQVEQRIAALEGREYDY